jgi:hypothetical protein
MPTEPTNKSLLSPIGFRFTIQKLPHVNYFCTAASIPDMALGRIDSVTNPFNKLPIPSTKLEFSDLSIKFKIDEDMKNYREIFDWMNALGFPDSYDQKSKWADTYSDASLIIMTSQYQPNIEIKFIDLYPSNLASVEFDISGSDIEFLSGDVTFNYRSYQINSIT